MTLFRLLAYGVVALVLVVSVIIFFTFDRYVAWVRRELEAIPCTRRPLPTLDSTLRRFLFASIGVVDIGALAMLIYLIRFAG
jgi:hypothetical protein